MIRKKLRYVKKFKVDVWNLRLQAQYLAFSQKDRSFPKDFAMSYKYYFLYFFKLYKKQRELRRIRKKPFVYRIDLIEKKVVRKKMKLRYVTLRLVKFYYAMFTYKQFKKLARLAKKKDGLYEHNFILFLEGRLVNFLFRSSLLENIFKAYYYIKGGFITVNRKVCTYPNEKCALFDFLSFLPLILYDIFLIFVFRLSMRLIMHPPLRYIYISFIYFFAYMFKMPWSKDIPNKKIIDLYRLTGYAILY